MLLHISFFIMSRRYDPQHIFNDKRTVNQQKAMTHQVKLVDETPPRIDKNLLDKYYQTLIKYHYLDNIVPIPREIHLNIDSLFTFY